MTHKTIVIDLSVDQWQKLEDLYLAQYGEPKYDRQRGVILGQPDLTNGKIKFHAFPYWAFKILAIATFIIGTFSKGDTKTPLHPIHGKRYFWLGK